MLRCGFIAQSLPVALFAFRIAADFLTKTLAPMAFPAFWPNLKAALGSGVRPPILQL
jgi:hypothetical protein